MSHIDTIGATPPNATEVKFQQNATLVALILVGKVSATIGFNVPSVMPIKAPSRRDMITIKEADPLSKEDMNGIAETKIPIAPHRMIYLLLILSDKYPKTMVDKV
jgi:hypothetical protein